MYVDTSGIRDTKKTSSYHYKITFKQAIGVL